jgi:Domain of unknown function (DUF4157)
MKRRVRIERDRPEFLPEPISMGAGTRRTEAPAAQAATEEKGIAGSEGAGHSFGNLNLVYQSPGSAGEQAEAAAGQPLPGELRRRFEDSVGASLAGVRLHADAQSSRIADTMDARAVTAGQDIHFGAGEYQPDSKGGESLLAHEIVHVAQQAGPLAHGRVGEPHASTSQLETEASGLASAVARGVPVRVSAAPTIAAAAQPRAGAERESLEDLDIQSDTAWMSEDMKKKQHSIARAEKDRAHRNVTIFNANYVGSYEREGMMHEVPTIHIGPKGRAAGGETLVQLEIDYNDYVPLLRSTLRAMGRLKDLDNAGAKLDPGTLAADPRLAKGFKPLNAERPADNEKIGDFDTWSAHATEERIAIASMGAGFHQLKAAISGFRAAEGMLKRRKKQGDLAVSESKKAVIDQKVEMLEKIIDKCFKAVEMAQGIEAMLAFSPEFKELETIEGPGGKKSTMTHQQSEGWGKRTRSMEQSIGGAAATMGEQLKKRHTQVESWLKEGGVTLKNVLIFATGDAKEYERLTQEISRLKNDIAQLGFDIETDTIKQAEEQLEGMKLEIGVRTQQAGAKKGQARAAARTFGQSMAGGEGALAMYAAQAYQDLALFGGEADRLRKARIDRYLGWLYGFLKDTPWVAEGHGWYDDWIVMREWGQQMVEQREFFSRRTPEWQQKATQWNAFFATLTGGGLVK